MRTEKEKAKETIKWLDFFNQMRSEAYTSCFNVSSMNNMLKLKIKEMKEECEKILNKEI